MLVLICKSGAAVTKYDELYSLLLDISSECVVSLTLVNPIQPLTLSPGQNVHLPTILYKYKTFLI